MNCSFVTLLVLAGALCPFYARAEQWIRLRTAQFELDTTNTEREGRELIRVLGTAQSFIKAVGLLAIHAPQDHPPTPVRIIALRSSDEYQPFRLSPTAFGSFQHSRFCDYIVLQDIRPEHRGAAIHEYMHLLFRQAGLTLPLWLNEGLADFYSSLEANGGQSRVGGILPSRIRTLQAQSLVDLTTLFAVNHKSPFYNNSKQLGIFYAESWALVHMLTLHPDYAPGLPGLVRLISTGVSPGSALGEVYGKSIPQIQSALQAYLPQLSSSSSFLVEPLSLETQVAPVSPWREDVSSDVVLNDTAGTLQFSWAASSGQ